MTSYLCSKHFVQWEIFLVLFQSLYFLFFFSSKFQFSFWISQICCWFSSSGLELFPYFIHMLGFFLYPLFISILSDEFSTKQLSSSPVILPISVCSELVTLEFWSPRVVMLPCLSVFLKLLYCGLCICWDGYLF